MLEQKIQDVLGSQEVVRTSPESSVTEAAKIMAESHVGAILVGNVDDIFGIFTERDMLERVVIPGLAADETALREVLTPEAVFVSPSDTMHAAMLIMKQQRSRYVLVKDGGQVVGIISVVDVLRAVLDEGAEEANKFDHLWQGIPI
ncbi:MAG: CBS domain-containing protein [Methyloligellaceae bacterium]